MLSRKILLKDKTDERVEKFNEELDIEYVYKKDTKRANCLSFVAALKINKSVKIHIEFCDCYYEMFSNLYNQLKNKKYAFIILSNWDYYKFLFWDNGDKIRFKIQDYNLKTQVEEPVDIEMSKEKFFKIFKIPYYVIQDSIKDMNDTLSEVMNLQTEDIPERLHAELIDWIEKRGECICGNKIKHDDVCYEILEKWRHIVPPESIGILAKQMKAKTQDKIRLGTGLNEKLTDYKHQIYQKADDKDAFNDKIDRLREELAKADDTSEIQSKLKMARNNADLTRTDLNQCIELIAKIESELIKYKKEYEVAISDNKEGKKILKWKSITEKLLDNFQTQIEKDEQEKRELLIKYVKEAFERIYGSSFSIEIDSNYRITTNTPVEKSTGQGMSVIFAFLAGLLQVIKTDKGRKDDNKSIELESYPLVLDAPFSALDKKRIAAICDVLPIVSEQIIIFIKDTDGELAKKEMSGKIGKSYRLTKIDNSDMETEIIPEEI